MIVAIDDLIALDQYILQRATEVQKTIQQAYEEMNFHLVTNDTLTNFCINDSNWFLFRHHQRPSIHD